MTEKEMRKLSRADLLELLIAQMKENQRLEALLAQKDAQLNSRAIAIREAGSIAEASMALNQVFAAAQAAADQYLVNIRAMERDMARRCRHMPEETEGSRPSAADASQDAADEEQEAADK